MKTILSSIAIVCMVITIKANDLKIQPFNFMQESELVDMNNPIDLSSIIKDVLSNKRAYFMTGSLTILKAPKTGDVASSFDLSFRNSLVSAYKGRDYIQMNPKATRNDNNSSNEVRIYVHQDRNGKVNKSNVKLNWKSGATGEIVGILSNVTVLYQDDSLLITGSFQKSGYTVGVSLAISKEAKLI